MNNQLVDKNLLDKEIAFINYIDNNTSYPYNDNFYKFIILRCDVSKDIIYDLFDGFLDDLIVLKFKPYYCLIYHNKERISLNDYIDSISFDLETNVDLFDGFIINKEDSKNLEKFISIFDKFYINHFHGYNTISNIVLSINDRDVLNELSSIVISKYKNDLEFIKIVKNLFNNNLNISKTANEIFMHRNTLNNKIASFEYETGLSIQKFTDALALYELLK